MKRSRLYYLYIALAIIGLVVTWHFNILYMQSGGSFAPAPFWQNAFANDLTAGITLDVYIAAIAFAVWVFPESRRLGIRWPWLYVILCFFGALACALPLFLAIRIRAMEKPVAGNPGLNSGSTALPQRSAGN